MALCTGDVMSFNCSIIPISQSDTIVWHITYPGLSTVRIRTPLNPSSLYREDMNGLIKTTISRNERGILLESIASLTVLEDVPFHRVQIVCNHTGHGFKIFNLSSILSYRGMIVHAVFCPCCILPLKPHAYQCMVCLARTVIEAM